MDEYLQKLRFGTTTLFRVIGCLVSVSAWLMILMLVIQKYAIERIPGAMMERGAEQVFQATFTIYIVVSLVGVLVFYFASWLAWITVPRIGAFHKPPQVQDSDDVVNTIVKVER